MALAMKLGVRCPSKPRNLQTCKRRWAQCGYAIDNYNGLLRQVSAHGRLLAAVQLYVALVRAFGGQTSLSCLNLWLQAHIRWDDLCSAPGLRPPVGPPPALSRPPPDHSLRGFVRACQAISPPILALVHAQGG